jgi:hypothetical protein
VVQKGSSELGAVQIKRIQIQGEESTSIKGIKAEEE